MGEFILTFEWFYYEIIHEMKCMYIVHSYKPVINVWMSLLFAVSDLVSSIFNWSHKIGGNKLLHIHLSISPQLNVILSVFRGLSCGNFSVEWNKIIENCCSTVESLRWSPWDWEEFVPSRPRETDIPNMCLISIFILYSFHSHFFHWTLNQQHQKNYDVYKYAKMI